MYQKKMHYLWCTMLSAQWCMLHIVTSTFKHRVCKETANESDQKKYHQHVHNDVLNIIVMILKTRSTQRAQTSLAEADHYSHIVHCKNAEPWLWKTTHPPKKKKKKKRFWIITFTTIWVWYHYYGVFCSFTHLTIPRWPPKFNQFLLVLLRTRP